MVTSAVLCGSFKCITFIGVLVLQNMERGGHVRTTLEACQGHSNQTIAQWEFEACQRDR